MLWSVKLVRCITLGGWASTIVTVAYDVECETCKLHYIGRMGQHFCDRRNQLQRDIKQKSLSNSFNGHLGKMRGM